MIQAIIIDDEKKCISLLEKRIKESFPDITIAATASQPDEGIKLIRQLEPDLVFLDIEMPKKNGFEVLEATRDILYDVIFTTAFDTYAMQAFEANALDYLLKPIEPKRLALALQKIGNPQPSAPERPVQRDSKIFIKDGERCWFVKLEAITLLESEGNYTRVYFDGNRPLLLRSLGQLEQRLDPALFFRASRRHIVNLDYVVNVSPSSTGALTLQLNGGLLIEMSRRRALEFKQLMQL